MAMLSVGHVAPSVVRVGFMLSCCDYGVGRFMIDGQVSRGEGEGEGEW